MRLLAALLAAVALVAACGEDGGVAAGDELVGRTFVSDRVTGHELVPDTRVSLEFRDDGTINAHTGCNHLFGELDVDGDRLAVSSMGGTEMGCDPERHAQDDWLMEFLGSGPAWELAGDTLSLTSGGVVITLLDREVADPDRPLQGTAWVLDGIVTGDAVSSVPQGVQGTLSFEEGLVGMRVCNEGSAELTVGEGELTIGELTLTKMACGQPAMEVEAAVVATLDGTIAYDIEAATLRLTHPQGHGLVFRAES